MSKTTVAECARALFFFVHFLAVLCKTSWNDQTLGILEYVNDRGLFLEFHLEADITY